MSELCTETMTGNIGSQHLSTQAVLSPAVELDTEMVAPGEAAVGYLHTPGSIGRRSGWTA